MTKIKKEIVANTGRNTNQTCFDSVGDGVFSTEEAFALAAQKRGPCLDVGDLQKLGGRVPKAMKTPSNSPSSSSSSSSASSSAKKMTKIKKEIVANTGRNENQMCFDSVGDGVFSTEEVFALAAAQTRGGSNTTNTSTLGKRVRAGRGADDT
jgi:hypothetical protein